MLSLCVSQRRLARVRFEKRVSTTRDGRRRIWSFMKQPEPPEKLAVLDEGDPLIKNMASDRTIPSVKRITPEQFHRQYRLPSQPVIIRGLANGWPASTKWKNPTFWTDHFSKIHVPIEVGASYIEPGWTQKLVTFKDFVDTYITLQNKSNLDANTGNAKKIGYLSQHKLLTQLPILQKDIQTPPHCTADGDQLSSIHCWIGPKSTVTPLHKDPYHNLLAQVVGYKYIRLYHPSASSSLYPFSDLLFRNTSQVNVERPDYVKFPLAQDLEYRECLLQPGEALYIPEGYWHFVKSASYSCSVSFWFVPKPSALPPS